MSQYQVLKQQTNSGAYNTTYETEFEIPTEVCLDVYLKASRSSLKCSSNLAHSLFRGLATARRKGTDTAEVSLWYRDDGWKTWVLNIVDAPDDPQNEYQQNLAEFEDFVEQEL